MPSKRQPPRAPRPTNRGAALEFTEEELGRLAEPAAQESELALAAWREHAPSRMRALLESGSA
jgi:hypothetical protein